MLVASSSVAPSWLVWPTEKKLPPVNVMVGVTIGAGVGAAVELEHEEIVSEETRISKGTNRIEVMPAGTLPLALAVRAGTYSDRFSLS